jgi:hypothetical protein
LISLDTAATEVFQILRSYDYSVMMYDEDGNQVYEPDDARRFFAKPENILVSLVDDGDNSSIRLYIGKSTDIMSILGLDQTLRTTATKYNMIFNLKRYGRDLEPADFASKASVTEARKGTAMNILEGMYGTTRSSYLKLENARMIVRHSKKIDEMVMGSRGRHIDAIFVENAQGERFLFPTRQLSPARAMTQHVNQGGSFADQVGQQIQRMATDYANLGQASSYIQTNMNALQESAMVIRETCRKQMYEMRKCFERLSRAHSPDKWTAFAEAIEEKFKTLNEGNAEPTPIDLTEVKNILTIEGIELDEGVLTTVAETMRDCECTTDVEEGRQEKAFGYANGNKEPMVGILGHGVVEKVWDELRAGKIVVNEMPHFDVQFGRETPESNKLAFKLGKLADVTANLSLTNLFHWVGEVISDDRPHPKKNALLTLAKKAVEANFVPLSDMPPEGEDDDSEIDETFFNQNPVSKEVTEWLDQFKPSTVLAEREDDDDYYDDEPLAAERFPGNNDPTSFESGAHEDAQEEAIDRVVSDFRPEDFLKKCGSDFDWNYKDTLDPEELEYDKKYILRSLAYYLEKEVERDYGFVDVDMKDEAEYLFDKVAPILTGAGYQLNELAGSFSRADIIIQTNQGVSLKREVTKAASIDPYTGNEVPTDASYIERLRTLAGMPWNR